MSKVGYLRYKIATPIAGTREIVFYKNGVELCTHTVRTRAACEGFKLLKWLDENGQYRFFSFLSQHAIKDNPKQIGTISNQIESLLDTQTDKSNIGYTNERKLTLRQTIVTSLERSLLSSIFTSPKVYLYVGDYIDYNTYNFIEVIASGDNIVKKEKDTSGTFEITVALPTHYTISQV